LAAIFGGLALGATDRLKHGREDNDRKGPPMVTTTQISTTTQVYTTTVAGSVPAPTGQPPKEPPSKNVCYTFYTL
jgi:hypothetical protein